jgi:hypothetical protein
MLREIWRVLAPEGRLLLIVPNRRGLWARFDATPFGHGRPYSRGQLERLLSEALLSPLEWTNALYMPPLNRAWAVRWATVFERMGARLWPGFAGVIIVEARKELMGALPRAVPVKGRRQPVPATNPSFAPRSSHRHRPLATEGSDATFPMLTIDTSRQVQREPGRT